MYSKPTGRVAEMVLGILGSVFGIIGGVFALMLGSISNEFEASDSGQIMGLGIAVILVCIITLIVSCIINKKRIVMGVILVLGGIFNFIFIGLFGILSGILISVAGVLALVRK
ncbi:Uncharacterised protein [Staphylococcus agnetis]|uniref:DUF4064 domain-containing protein n=1 Tax=Staphylococcus agnetis TaxID=985762 RepID=UPI000E0518F7|nr:DUF4064 domain-containing protein [Staphylococcus agnetis]SUK17565.1 Uncharacterised protein [Staphylococcus agnetis]